MRRTLAVFVLIPLLLPAWNDAGHRTVAYIAWSLLTPAAKARASRILQAHPDYRMILSRTGSEDPRGPFLTAATWPDLIRDDPRFARGAPLLPGFPDMNPRSRWHFINIPFPREFARVAVDPKNAASQLAKLTADLRSSGPVLPAEAYALPWVLHLVGDLHQPLHTVARFTLVDGQPVHDRGGNECLVNGGSKLHSFWDGLPGRLTDDESIARMAAALRQEYPRDTAAAERKPDVWLREGLAAAGSHVYNFQGECTEDAPAALPPEYVARARALARERVALAGYRLAAILNETLGR